MTVDKLWIAGAKLDNKLLIIKFDWLVKHRYYGLKLNDSEELRLSNGNIRFIEIEKHDYEIALFSYYEFNSDIHRGCGSITLDIEDQAQYIIRADENILRVYKLTELIDDINKFKVTPGGAAVTYKVDLPAEIKDKLNKLNRRLRLIGSNMEYKNDGVYMKRVYSDSPAIKSIEGKIFCVDNGEGNTEYSADGKDYITAKNVGIHIVNQEYIDTRMYQFATNMIIKSENKHRLDRLSIFTSWGFGLFKIIGDIEAESCSNVLIRKGIKGNRLYNKCIIKTHKYVDLSRYEFIGFVGLNIMTTEKELFIDFKDKYTIMCRNSFIVPNNEIKIYIYTSNKDMLKQLISIGYGLSGTANLGTLQNIKVIKNRKEWRRLQGEK